MTYTVEQSQGWTDFRMLRRDRIGFMADIARRGIDIRSFHIGPRLLFVANHPDLIRDILITHDWNFIKGRGLRASRPVLGEGLVTSEGELHRRQRRLVQPAFHSTRLAGYARSMVQCAHDAQARWPNGTELALDTEMATLTLRIVGKTLFSADLESDAAGVGAALDEAMRAFQQINSPLAILVSLARRYATRRASRSRHKISSILAPIIRQHRDHPEQFDDMLSMLISASEGTGSMSDELLEDECLTLFLAGQETTANALSWAWYLLSQHPEVYDRLLAEADQVLAGRAPTLDDLPRLAYTGRVFREVLRLYPPAWIIVREALTAYKLGPVDVPAGSQIALCPYATHHDPRFWNDPEAFDPDRWLAIASERNGFAYFPFAAGTRNCIGESFATMEGVLVLAALAQQVRFEFLPGQRVATLPQLTLRSRYPLRFRVHHRAGPGNR